MEEEKTNEALDEVPTEAAQPIFSAEEGADNWENLVVTADGKGVIVEHKTTAPARILDEQQKMYAEAGAENAPRPRSADLDLKCAAEHAKAALSGALYLTGSLCTRASWLLSDMGEVLTQRESAQLDAALDDVSKSRDVVAEAHMAYDYLSAAIQKEGGLA